MAKRLVRRRDGIYQRPDAKGFWGSWTDAHGRRRRHRFDAPTLEQARMMLAAERLKVEEQIKFGKPLPSEDSFAVFADEFMAYQRRRIASKVGKGKLSQAEYDRQSGIVEVHLKPFFGTMRLALVRKQDVAAYINARMGEAGEGTIIKEVNTLKRLFNVAIEFEKIEANPAHKAPVPKAPAGRVRYLSIEELGRVFNACIFYDRISKDAKEREREGLPLEPLPEHKQWLRNFAGLSVTLGTRRGELLRARWEDVSIPRREIRLRHTTNGKERLAYINDEAQTVLSMMSNGKLKGRGLLFPDVTPAQVTVAFIRACDDAGISDFSLHDLRHTYATHHV